MLQYEYYDDWSVLQYEYHDETNLKLSLSLNDIYESDEELLVVQELCELLDLVVWNLTVVKLRAGLTFKGVPISNRSNQTWILQ